MSTEAEREMWGAIARQERGHDAGVRANRYAGECCHCGQTVGAEQGLLLKSRTGRGWIVSHRPARWQGSPVSGQMVGGCPDPVTS